MANRKSIFLIFCSIALFVSIASGFAFAQFDNRNLEVPLPGLGDTKIPILPDYVKYIFNFAIGIGGLIAFLALIYGGVRYLTSAGNPSAIGDAKDRISAAFLGLAVLLGSYLILTTINPQLAILSLPERIFLNPEDLVAPPSLSAKNLYYTEIPAGGIIDLLLDEERMENIEEISWEIKTSSEDLFQKSSDLNLLLGQCGCFMTFPQCSGSECGGGFCSGNPCPAQSEINEKRGEIPLIAGEIKQQQEKLEKELADFRKLYNDLLSAEQLIKNCQGVGPRGGLMFLYGSNDFWEYADKLKDDRAIEEFVPDFPFEYISSNNPYFSATFYCAEKPEAPLTAGPPQDISFKIEDTTGMQSNPKEIFCGKEITIGQAIDNAEGVAGKLIQELENINNNISKEIEAGGNLVSLSEPGNCVVSSCSTFCAWVSIPCEVEGEGEGEGEGGGESSGGGESAIYRYLVNNITNWLKIPAVFSQGDCGYCYIEPCSGSSCPGDPVNKSQFDVHFIKAKDANERISASGDMINKILEEKDVEDEFKISEIFKALKSSQEEIWGCFTPKVQYAKFNRGEESNFESLANCSGLKQGPEINLRFYDKEGEEIKECYGPSYEKPDLMDNFFCCLTNVSF